MICFKEPIRDVRKESARGELAATSFDGSAEQTFKEMGTKSSIIEMARQAALTNPDIQRIIEIWDRLGEKPRKLIRITDMCASAKVPVAIFMGAIYAVGATNSHHLQGILAARYSPKVVKKNIEMALTDGGVKDREMLLTHTGFLPQPRGTQISILNQNNQQQSQDAAPPTSFERDIIDVEVVD